jgi:Uma2 family endonuclease
MATVTMREPEVPSSPSGVVFDDVTWEEYETMIGLVGERPIRVTYDQGTMEVYMPSLGHERDAYVLGRMVDTLTEELGITVEGGGTTRHKRQDLEKGAEPDQCYWLHERALRIRDKRELDLSVDPVPDLIIEVDVTSASVDRLKIFAALGVPEVWRYDGRFLEILQLGEGGYQSCETSRCFPGLSADAVGQFLEQGRNADKTTWIRSFRSFVKDHLASGFPPQGETG